MRRSSTDRSPRVRRTHLQSPPRGIRREAMCSSTRVACHQSIARRRHGRKGFQCPTGFGAHPPRKVVLSGLMRLGSNEIPTVKSAVYNLSLLTGSRMFLGPGKM
jgi:hypothetical protein